MDAGNIQMEVGANGQLIIRIDLNKDLGRSKSGKSILVASTYGNVSIPLHPEIKLGLNLYK